MLSGYAGYHNGSYYYGEGLPIYTWRLKKYAGVNEKGESTWYVENEDGSLGKSAKWSEGSYFACGDPTPDLYGGFGTSLSFKGIDVGVNFTYSIGGKSYDSGYQSLMSVPYDSWTGFNFHKDMLDAWSPNNRESNIPRLQYNDTDASSSSDRFLINASYLNLQSINIGYTLPKSLTRRLGLTKVRVYGAADNVYLWSKRKGFDPRTSFTGSPSNEQYAFVRTISGGITLQF